MILDAFLTPFFPDSDGAFEGSVVAMIDVLRASSTICAAVHNGAKKVIPCETREKAVKIYGSLSKETRFLGGERAGVKPDSFDAGNSPLEYDFEAVEGKSVILTTTNGTKIFQKAKSAEKRIISGFVNLSASLNFIKSTVDGAESEIEKIVLMCAGSEGRLSYEDTVCAGALASALVRFYPEARLTDTAFAAYELYDRHKGEYKSFLKNREHPKKLAELGFEADIDLCLTIDAFPVVPVIEGNEIQKADF